MKLLLISILLPAAWCWAQLPLDLSGEWRRSTNDDPWTKRPRLGIYWLRRTVEVPAGIDPSPLALTLGTVTETYEVFVNGQRIGMAGEFSPEKQQLYVALAVTIASILWSMWRVARTPGKWDRFALPALVLLALVSKANRFQPLALFPRLEVGHYAWKVSGLILIGIASLIAFVLLASLVADRREKQRLTGELEAACAVQQLLLPHASLHSAGFETDAVYQPAQEVGGDFYSTRVTPDGSLIVLVGDVSGNAGRPSPYCDGREVVSDAGLPLGVRDERFTFVSDGVVEAENAQRELFGFERTRAISAQAWGQNDDINVVTVRRNS